MDTAVTVALQLAQVSPLPACPALLQAVTLQLAQVSPLPDCLALLQPLPCSWPMLALVSDCAVLVLPACHVSAAKGFTQGRIEAAATAALQLIRVCPACSPACSPRVIV